LNSLWKVLSSTIGHKLIIGFTGVFLIIFVIAHLSGNLLLYVGLEAYNDYAYALHKNESLLHAVEIILLALFVTHILMAISVSRQHKKARPDKYAQHRSKQERSKVTPSAVMLVSGIIVLGFLLLHLADLRFDLRHSVPPSVEPAEHTLLVLQDPISAIVYFFGSLFLGWHIWHAFESVFQTYGLNHPRYTPLLKNIGILLAIILAIGFASFPVLGILLKYGVFK